MEIRSNISYNQIGKWKLGAGHVGSSRSCWHVNPLAPLIRRAPTSKGRFKTQLSQTRTFPRFLLLSFLNTPSPATIPDLGHISRRLTLISHYSARIHPIQVLFSLTSPWILSSMFKFPSLFPFPLNFLLSNYLNYVHSSLIFMPFSFVEVF